MPTGSFTSTFHIPIQKFLLTCILPEITKLFFKWQFYLDQSIQVTFDHSQGATYNMEIKLDVVLGKPMSIRGEGASNKTDSSTLKEHT